MDKQVLVTRSSMPQLEEYVKEISELWDTHWITNMGCKHQMLEKMLIEYLDVNRLELVTNGHMALELALQSLQLEGEVITTPFTFASTTHAIIRSGLKPVFCDIKKDDYTIDEKKIEQLISNKTCAILPVHVYGNVCNVEKIQEIAEKYHLKVIYDAAHAFGVRYREKGIGGFGDASCFSFHATKVFNTIEGGAVCYRNEQIKRVHLLKNFGFSDENCVQMVGTNAKMSEFHAAMGICNLRHIEEEINKRKRKVKLYRERLREIEGIQINVIQENVKSNYAYFPILVDENEYGHTREYLYQKLAQNNIFARRYFYPLTNSFICFKGKYGGDGATTPVACDVADRVLTLPLYADLEDDYIEKICQIILKEKRN